MVGGYFKELLTVVEHIFALIPAGRSIWIVAGDSRYAGVQIETGRILVELASDRRWDIELFEECHSKRASAQQGGRKELPETLVVLNRP
jgi:hypothetical protein